MGYLTYYAGWMLLSYALRSPWAMAGALVFYVLRPYIPDPLVVLKTYGQMRILDAQIAANPANVTARRDLAMLWLERLRPGRALELLREARRRAPNDAELLYLTGLARLRSGDAAGALEPLVEAMEINPRLRFGEPYLLAGEALVTLERLEEAEDALERYVRFNSSSIQGLVRLAEVRRRHGDRPGTRKALDEALSTWSQLPRFRRRSELGWWLRAHVARLRP
jgi:predicted Zn-dependent protease